MAVIDKKIYVNCGGMFIADSINENVYYDPRLRLNNMAIKDEKMYFLFDSLYIFDPSKYITNVPINYNVPVGKYIDGNNVKSAILNNGTSNWNTNVAKYEVPKGSGKHAIYNTGLWIGGLDDGNNLHIAAQRYRQTGVDYWTGPLDTSNANIDSATVSQYNKVWKNGYYGGKRFIDSSVVTLCTAYQFADQKNRRGIGFDKKDFNPDIKNAPALSSPLSFGHSGYTGTYAWVDPKYNLVYIFLSNRSTPPETTECLVHSTSDLRLVTILSTASWQKLNRYKQTKNNLIMALIKAVNGILPEFGNDCYLAENATITGDVVMGDQCSVWFNAVIRGDVHYIRVGNRVNGRTGP